MSMIQAMGRGIGRPHTELRGRNYFSKTIDAGAAIHHTLPHVGAA
jgi:hypothetical protein